MPKFMNRREELQDEIRIAKHNLQVSRSVVTDMQVEMNAAESRLQIHDEAKATLKKEFYGDDALFFLKKYGEGTYVQRITIKKLDRERDAVEITFEELE